MTLDIISYSAASKAAGGLQKNKRAFSKKSDETITGKHDNLKERLDAIQKKVEATYGYANEMIIQNAVNIAKAYEKLNQVAKLSKYRHTQFVFDDLRDLTGIDFPNCKNIYHDLSNGRILKSNQTQVTVIETASEMATSYINEVLLTIGVEDSNSIELEVSRDGGENWFKAINEKAIPFFDEYAPKGKELKIRITIKEANKHIDYISYIWR